MASKDPETVKVVVRCRPMNKKEIEDQRTRIVDMDLKTNQVRERLSTQESARLAPAPKAAWRPWGAPSAALLLVLLLVPVLLLLLLIRAVVVVADGAALRCQVRVKNPKDVRETPKPFTFDKIYDWNSTQEPVFVETARPIIDQVIGGYNGTIFAYGQTGTGKTFTMEGVGDVPELHGIIVRPDKLSGVACEFWAFSDRLRVITAAHLPVHLRRLRGGEGRRRGRR